MRTKFVFLLGIWFCLTVQASKVCPETFAIVASGASESPSVLFEQKKIHQIKNKEVVGATGAGDLARRLVKENPQLRFEDLENLLVMAHENAVQHGQVDGASEVEMMATKTPDGLVVHILNDRHRPLPESLKDKVFDSKTKPFEVPQEERDKERGNYGMGVSMILESLRGVYKRPHKSATVSWKEVTSPISGKPKVLFEFTIPN